MDAKGNCLNHVFIKEGTIYVFICFVFIYLLHHTVIAASAHCPKGAARTKNIALWKGARKQDSCGIILHKTGAKVDIWVTEKKKTLSSKIFVFIFYEHFCKITKGQNRKLQQTNSWKEGTDGFEHEESYTSAIMVKTDILLPYFVWFINEFRRTQTEDNCVLTISFLILSNANCKAIRHKWLQWFMSRLKRDWLTVSCSFCWEPVSMFLCSMGFIFGIIFGLVFDLTLKGRGSY